MRSLNECDAGRAADRGRGLMRAVWLKEFGGRGAASVEYGRGRRPYSGLAQRERDMSAT